MDEIGGGFIWTRGVIAQFDGLPGDEVIDVGGLNRRGEVVGTSWNLQHGAFEGFLRSGNQVIGLGTLPGHKFSEAYAVNDNGDVAGAAFVDNGNYWVKRAFLWKDNEMIDLGVLPDGEWSSALAVNNARQVVGYAVTADDVVHPVLWQAGSMIDLASVTGPGRAVAINEKGTLVGFGSNGAFLRSTQGTLRLGSILPRDINNSDQVVGSNGTSAVLWQDGVTYDLSDLLNDATQFVLRDARGINNAGQIVCNALHPQTLWHAVLLTPTSLGDLDADGVVGISDLVSLVNELGACTQESSSDLNRDGAVDDGDVMLLIGNWTSHQ
jgi:probable HAF family extracellular repeat protein